ncbi:MAG: CHAT domain-containing protein [Thermoanaerobaculia bacterium]
MLRRRPLLRSLAWMALSLASLAAAAGSLIPGQSAEGRLAAGDALSYTVELEVGPAWRISVEQQGIDVELAAESPDGHRVAVDGPFDRQGMETLLLEPAASGVWKIEVTAREPAAAKGRFEIRLDELAPGDRRIAAERAETRAGELYRQGTAESRREALAEHGRAAGLWRDLGDRGREARSLYAAAVLARLTGDARGGLERAAKVQPLWHGLDHPLEEGATWNEIGLDHFLLGEIMPAREAFEAALALQSGIGDRYGEGSSRSNLCVTHLARGELKAGLACYEGALPVLREVRASALEGSALTNVGRVYDILGEPEKALASYQNALDLMRAMGDRAGEARILTHLAPLDRELGKTQDALSHLGRALDAFRALQDDRWQGAVLHNLGAVYQSLGDWPQARSSYEEALRYRRKAGDRAEEATTLTNLGQVLAALGNPREAADSHRQALQLRRTLGDRWGEGVALTQLGRASLASGEPSAALASFGKAIEILRGAGAVVDQSEALRSRGEAELALDRPAQALASLEEALRLARAAGHRAGEAQATFFVARAEQRLGRLAEARAHAESALDILEDLRTRIASPDLRASFSGLRHQVYQFQIDLLMECHRAEPGAGWDRAALEASERSRARTLLELLNEAGVAIRQGVDDRLLERRASLLQRLGSKAERALKARAGAPERTALEEERLALLRELDVAEAEVREKSPAYADLTQPKPLRTAEIQELLGPDTLLLAYSLGQDRGYLWAVTSGEVRSYELPAREPIETAARRLHEALSAFDVEARRREAQEAAELGRLLLGPVADRLGGMRLVIVPDGALQYVPFGALPLPGSTEPAVAVLERHEVVELPSASSLAVQRRMLARRPPAPKRLAVLADPVFDAGDARLAATRPPGTAATRGSAIFERLPATRREAEAIASLVPAGQSMVALDFAAARPLVLGDGLSGFQVVHFATHGVIDAERPALSGLALSMVDEAGEPREGFLHLHDIYNLKLNADLVVLSGCRTALGKEVRGEGLIGLARGFQYAGAPRVVASLWPVEDLATAALMERFYRGLWIEKKTAAAALREAQLWVREQRRWRDPYFWAGFILEGEWR